MYLESMQREIRQAFSVGYSFPVLFTRSAFEPSNLILRDTFRRAGEKKHRVLLVIDSNVADATAGLLAKIQAYGAAHADAIEWAGPPFIVRGGEICKSDPREVEELHGLVAKYKIDRQSFILAIGGGAVLDAVGYAAATAHRGVRLVRMPTTTLGQNDAGIGVKNSVNAYGRKNFLGTFAPPFAVVNDFDFLRTLPARELRAGFAEAVKIACIKDLDFLSWMHRERKALGAFVPEAVEQLIERCAKGHIEHVGSADPFESGSARPLDFGHWSAHFLEELTGNELRHGEAVAIGCALDSTYAFEQGLLSEVELNKVMQTLEGMGFELFHPALQRMDIDEALAQFREHLGGEMCITVPDPLGKRRELHQIDVPLVKQCIAQLAERHRRREQRGQKSATVRLTRRMLTYCTNIHPGESWAHVQRGIAENVPQIRDALRLPGNFPIGVWLSGRAQRDIAADGSREFQEWMKANRCEVQSINGFPYGDFHAGRVKENVYLPDWRETERSDYSAGLARILASWLPEGKTGVISTVPLAFQKLDGEHDLRLVRKNLAATLEVIDAIAQSTGKQIILALEAEPACMLETTQEVIRFFAELELPANLSQHLGICFDCCHHAVEFESPAKSLRQLQDAGIRIAQAHVTCALRVSGGELSRLARFSEPVYLHQTVGRRTDGSLVRFDDLPQALAAKVDGRDFDEWRVHFHVPVFQAQLGDCRTTQPELQEMLRALPRETPLVVETYTFGVLPPELQARTMPESIARELQWVRSQVEAQ